MPAPEAGAPQYCHAVPGEAHVAAVLDKLVAATRREPVSSAASLVTVDSNGEVHSGTGGQQSPDLGPCDIRTSNNAGLLLHVHERPPESSGVVTHGQRHQDRRKATLFVAGRPTLPASRLHIASVSARALILDSECQSSLDSGGVL